MENEDIAQYVSDPLSFPDLTNYAHTTVGLFHMISLMQHLRGLAINE